MTWNVSKAKLRIIHYLRDGESRPSTQIMSACKIRWLSYTLAISHLVRHGIVEQQFHRGLGPPATTYYMTPEWIERCRRIVLNVKNNT